MFKPVDAQIWRLALPTLGALLAPPLFVLIDTAMVGHLGTAELGGLAVASTLLTTFVGLLVFLAYATTATVARSAGAGDRAGALRAGVDGMWFAGLIGLVSAALLAGVGYWALRLLNADGEVLGHGLAYLYAAAPGVVGMLVVYAATGTLRGLGRVRFVLAVAVVGAVANVALNALFIYGLGLGVAGSGLGTALAETLMAVVLARAVLLEARASKVVLRGNLAGLKVVGRVGLPLFIRTVSLRIAILATVWAAAGLGVESLSGHQIVTSLWYLAAYAMDAVAIAAQTLIGEALGGSKPHEARVLLRRCVGWGIGSGVFMGAVYGALAPVLPHLFSQDPAVLHAATPAIWVAAACLPMAGLVFVLDGVLIGAGDGVYLAWTGVLNLLAYLPFLFAVAWWAPAGPNGLVWLWLSFAVAYMGARCVTLSLRSRSSAWLVLGSPGVERADSSS